MTEHGLDELARLEYPGRVIALGLTESNVPFAASILTGRSDSSRNRIYHPDKRNRTVHVRPFDPTKIDPTQAFWIYYPCMMTTEDGRVSVSNGLQTELIYSVFASDTRQRFAELALVHAVNSSQFRYDPLHGIVDITSNEIDKPNYTSRISGAIAERGMAMIVAREGNVEKDIIHIGDAKKVLKIGEVRMLPTYDGVDTGKNKLHQFTGDPLVGYVSGKTPEEIGQEFRRATCPKNDNLVALAVQFAVPKIQPYIFNAREKA